MLRTLLPVSIALLAAPAAAQEWTLDSDASRVGFVTQAFGGSVEGEFTDYEAAVTLDPSDLENARIEARVGTASGSTGNGQLDDSMLSEEGLAPQSHEAARFVSEDVRATDTGYEAHGTLSIRGTDQAVVLPFSLTIDGGRAVADAELEIARSDYGVGASGWGDTAANVTIVLHIEADAAN
ncbi:YceI family protein [Maricaulis sp. MIT060901]|uniref:YceI family protein n=1 Tax=Maricaulis sp. MIT060901 TaxID=3096993 RepID=UPI0039999913